MKQAPTNTFIYELVGGSSRWRDLELRRDGGASSFREPPLLPP